MASHRRAEQPFDVVSSSVHLSVVCRLFAYTTTAERMGLQVSECLFVDDMQINIEGAEAAGMPGFFFDHTRVAASCARLFELLHLPR